MHVTYKYNNKLALLNLSSNAIHNVHAGCMNTLITIYHTEYRYNTLEVQGAYEWMSYFINGYAMIVRKYNGMNDNMSISGNIVRQVK